MYDLMSSMKGTTDLLHHIIVTFNWPPGDKTGENSGDKSQKQVAVQTMHRELFSLFYVTQVMENTAWLQVGFDYQGFRDVSSRL